MKGACLFYLGWLVDDGKGRLVTPVSTSPENQFHYTDDNGEEATASVSQGSTMDMAIIRDLFGNTLHAAEVLGTDDDFQHTLKSALGRLLPYQIGSRGQIQEWQEDFAELEPTHRHVSHLFGLYPGDQISLRGTPQLAARRGSRWRVAATAGPGGAWPGRSASGTASATATTRTRCWTRCSPSPRSPICSTPARRSRLTATSAGPPASRRCCCNRRRKTRPIAPARPSFILSLLPALPSAWPSGSVTGLRARGGFEVGITWNKGKVVSYHVTSDEPRPVKVRVNGELKTVMSEETIRK